MDYGRIQVLTFRTQGNVDVGEVKPAYVVSPDSNWLLRLSAARKAGERLPATAADTALCAHACLGL